MIAWAAFGRPYQKMTRDHRLRVDLVSPFKDSEQSRGFSVLEV
jgi:hypothetical protein